MREISSNGTNYTIIAWNPIPLLKLLIGSASVFRSGWPPEDLSESFGGVGSLKCGFFDW